MSGVAQSWEVLKQRFLDLRERTGDAMIASFIDSVWRLNGPEANRNEFETIAAHAAVKLGWRGGYEWREWLEIMRLHFPDVFHSLEATRQDEVNQAVEVIGNGYIQDVCEASARECERLQSDALRRAQQDAANDPRAGRCSKSELNETPIVGPEDRMSLAELRVWGGKAEAWWNLRPRQFVENPNTSWAVESDLSLGKYNLMNFLRSAMMICLRMENIRRRQETKQSDPFLDERELGWVYSERHDISEHVGWLREALKCPEFAIPPESYFRTMPEALSGNLARGELAGDEVARSAAPALADQRAAASCPRCSAVCVTRLSPNLNLKMTSLSEPEWRCSQCGHQWVAARPEEIPFVDGLSSDKAQCVLEDVRTEQKDMEERWDGEQQKSCKEAYKDISKASESDRIKVLDIHQLKWTDQLRLLQREFLIERLLPLAIRYRVPAGNHVKWLNCALSIVQRDMASQCSNWLRQSVSGSSPSEEPPSWLDVDSDIPRLIVLEVGLAGKKVMREALRALRVAVPLEDNPPSGVKSQSAATLNAQQVPSENPQVETVTIDAAKPAFDFDKDRLAVIEFRIQEAANNGMKITRTDIWKHLLHSDAKTFQRYQSNNIRQTISVVPRFNSVLSSPLDLEMIRAGRMKTKKRS
jgi:hypothetical protein